MQRVGYSHSMNNRKRSELFGSGRDSSSKGPQFASGFSKIQNEESQAMLENENNQALDHLHSQLSTLKGLSMEINHEVESQNSFLDGMSNDMSNTTNLLSQTLSQLTDMVNSGGGNHMCYLIMFCVFIFLFLWFLMKL